MILGPEGDLGPGPLSQDAQVKTQSVECNHYFPNLITGCALSRRPTSVGRHGWVADRKVPGVARVRAEDVIGNKQGPRFASWQCDLELMRAPSRTSWSIPMQWV